MQEIEQVERYKLHDNIIRCVDRPTRDTFADK